MSEENLTSQKFIELVDLVKEAVSAVEGYETEIAALKGQIAEKETAIENHKKVAAAKPKVQEPSKERIDQVVKLSRQANPDMTDEAAQKFSNRFRTDPDFALECLEKMARANLESTPFSEGFGVSRLHKDDPDDFAQRQQQLLADIERNGAN